MKFCCILFLCIAYCMNSYSQQGKQITQAETDSIVKLWKKSGGTVLALRVTPDDLTLRPSDTTTLVLRLYAYKAEDIDANLIVSNLAQITKDGDGMYITSSLKKSNTHMLSKLYPKDVQPDYQTTAVVSASSDPMVASIVPVKTEIKSGEAIHTYKVKGVSAGEAIAFFHVKVKDSKRAILFEKTVSTSVLVDY